MIKQAKTQGGASYLVPKIRRRVREYASVPYKAITELKGLPADQFVQHSLLNLRICHGKPAGGMLVSFSDLLSGLACCVL